MSDNEKQVTTVQKLKSLIEAIDLMSEDEEWTPTSRQWNRIKSMIETLEEAPAPVPVAAPAPTYHTAVRHPQVQHSNAPNPAVSGALRFPEVPVGDAPSLPDGPGATSALRETVANPAAAQVSSGDAVPEAPPSSPGI